MSYTREQLHEAFTKVENKSNWKLPIDAVIQEDEIDITTEAIIYFAGCKPTFELINGGRFRCQAVGYYEAVGA